jgi:uncharacterized protein
MARTNDDVVLPFNAARIRDKYLVTNMLGAWDVLDSQEFRQLNALRPLPGTPLWSRLKARGIVVDEKSLLPLVQKYRDLNANLFMDTALHIAVVTTQCNLSCSYCQAGAAADGDMTVEVAAKVLEYLFGVRNPSVVLELQGGEPLANWPVVKFLIENARKFNTTGKKLRISLVSNLLLLDDDKIRVLAQNNVDVCTSLDGPREVHDNNRRYGSGKGSYDEVMARISRFKGAFGRPVSLLATITRASLGHAREIVDEYVRLGQREICLRPVNNMGAASCAWDNLGYSAEEFNAFYGRAMDHILELNQGGTFIMERMARVILTKVLAGKDPGYVDLMNPCGAGRMTMAYMPDGGCYPCDEARMIGEDMFRLGNILSETYDDMVKKENLMHLLQASCSGLWHAASVFSPWIGYCPVVNYALQRNIVPKVHCSAANKIMTGQFAYVFDKIVEQGAGFGIFKEWLSGDKHGKE